MLEIIVTSVEDAKAAESAGADRLELCVALSEDGLTPSIALIEAVVKAVTIPVHVIVRPHNRGFHYSASDIAIMRSDIAYIKEAGAAGIVVGALTEDGMIDEEALKVLLKEAEGLQVTFHRAFDVIHDQITGLHILLKYPQITRVLTSGGQEKAVNALPQLKKLIELTKGTSLTILVGSGLTAENVQLVIQETDAQEVHFGSGVRRAQCFMEPIDGEIIRQINKMI